jgi:ribosomal protein L7/L12
MDMNGDGCGTLQELTDLVSSTLANDHDIDRAVRIALDRDPSPIQVIKALRASTGMGLAEAKPIVDRNLPRDVQEANDRLRDEVWEAAHPIDGEARSPEP